MYKLPTFNGYTVDVRLKQFRQANRQDQILEFVEFNSPQGRALIAELTELARRCKEE